MKLFYYITHAFLGMLSMITACAVLVADFVNHENPNFIIIFFCALVVAFLGLFTMFHAAEKAAEKLEENDF